MLQFLRDRTHTDVDMYLKDFAAQDPERKDIRCGRPSLGPTYFRSTELGAAIAGPGRDIDISCVQDLTFAYIGDDSMVLTVVHIVCTSHENVVRMQVSKYPLELVAIECPKQLTGGLCYACGAY